LSEGTRPIPAHLYGVQDQVDDGDDAEEQDQVGPIVPQQESFGCRLAATKEDHRDADHGNNCAHDQGDLEEAPYAVGNVPP
jgi:hypothetical protein